jgi:hypothetical protein
MRKVRIQIEESQYEALRRLGHEEARSVADLVREAVDHLLRQPQVRALPPLPEIAGKYRPQEEAGGMKEHDRRWAAAVR